jgi:hypothetical protein
MNGPRQGGAPGSGASQVGKFKVWDGRGGRSS